MNLGVFGGTFNPVHLGHLRAAQEVCEELGLDRLIFIPARLPPHKTDRHLADAAKRLELVRLAIADNPLFSVSDLELKREGPSYTADTVAEIRESERPDTLWFVLGADQYREIHTWHRFREIIASVDLAVMKRPPGPCELSPPQGLGGEFAATGEGFLHRSGRRTRIVSVTQLDISSTMVRQALEENRSIRYLVPEPVFRALNER